MRPVDQGPHRPAEGLIGNCLAAGIASILELPLSAMPSPKTADEDDDWIHYWPELSTAVERTGHALLWIPEGGLVTGNVLVAIAGKLGGHFLLAGKTAGGASHVVVAKFPTLIQGMMSMDEAEIVHDPHPSRAGLAEISGIVLLVPWP